MHISMRFRSVAAEQPYTDGYQCRNDPRNTGLFILQNNQILHIVIMVSKTVFVGCAGRKAKKQRDSCVWSRGKTLPLEKEYRERQKSKIKSFIVHNLIALASSTSRK